MALTVTLDVPGAVRTSGGWGRLTGSIAFDSSYPAGGEAATDISKYFLSGRLYQLRCEQSGGYGFEYDKTNNKIKVFGPAPPIVYEEKHTIPATPYKVTLDYPAAAIMNVCSATAHYHMIEASDTLASGEVQLDVAMAAGTRTVLTFEATQTTEVIYVTYITQAWQDVWLNRQAATAVTAATEVCDLLTTACFIESCLMSGATGESAPEWVRGGDSAADSGECEVDWSDAGAGTAGDTTLTFNDTATGIVVTYIELPASGFLKDRFLEDQDTTIAAGVSAALLPAKPILFLSLNGQIPDYHAANERDPHNMQMLEGDALGTAGEFYVKYGVRPATGITGHILLNDSTTDAVSLTYVWGIPEEIPGVVPLEVRDTTNLAALSTVRFTALGLVSGI